jgi:hypothetical protein
MHGGASTGARTAAGLRRLAAVNTIHGRHAAGAAGDEALRIRTILRRKRLAFAADFLRAFLSPELAAALETREGPAALMSPRYGVGTGRVAGDRGETLCTSGGGTGGRDARGRFAARPRPELRGQAAAQAAARGEAAALAPWREAIARARLEKRTARLAKRAVRLAKRVERAAARVERAAGGELCCDTRRDVTNAEGCDDGAAAGGGRAAQTDAVGKKSMHQDGQPLADLACGGDRATTPIPVIATQRYQLGGTGRSAGSCQTTLRPERLAWIGAPAERPRWTVQ